MKQIDYSKAFELSVKGQLRARFALSQGRPIYRTVGDGLREYKIKLSLAAPETAEEIESVTYYMNDKSFYDPVAVSEDRDNDFTEAIFSYGDVPVIITVRINGRKIKQETRLIDLLEAGHEGDNSPAILEAIRDIRDN